MNRDILDGIRNIDYAGVTARIGARIADRVEKSGAAGVVLGLSGGVDSAVLAYICAKTMRDRTLAMVMPDTAVTPQSETADATAMVSLTGIQHKLLDIRPIVEGYCMYLEPHDRARGNLRARVRAGVLYYYANAKNLLVLGAGDRSELEMGYFTKFGDGASDMAPISGLYKLQVREAARFLGVPGGVISKKSSPHLWEGHDAESELGATYEEIDAVLHCMLDLGMDGAAAAEASGVGRDTVDRICSMRENSAHKREAPGP